MSKRRELKRNMKETATSMFMRPLGDASESGAIKTKDSARPISCEYELKSWENQKWE